MLGVPLFAAVVSLVYAAEIPNALDCRDPEETGNVECAQPIADVTAVTPGSSYIAKIDCKDCPYVERIEDKVVNADHILVCCVPGGIPWKHADDASAHHSC